MATKKEMLDGVVQALESNNIENNKSIIPILEYIVENNISADDAMCKMYEHCDNLPHKVWLLYVKAKGLLTEKFSEKDSMFAIHTFASFDQDNEVAAIRNAAKRFLHRYDKWRNIPDFINEMENIGVAGFTTGDLLYVIHPCVKPDSKELQCTVFGKSIGAISDTQHNSVKDFVDRGFAHAGIPPYADFLTFEELTKVERLYQEAPKQVIENTGRVM
jgi:hypothetical protein